MNEKRNAPSEPQHDAGTAASRRRRSLLIIGGLVVVAAGVIAALTLVPSAEPELNRAGLRPFDDARNEAKKESLDLGRGEYDLEILVQAPDKVCWNGYIGEAAIEGCKDTLYTVTGVKSPLGVNARKIDALKTALRVVVLFDGAVIENQTTKKPNGTLAFTVAL